MTHPALGSNARGRFIAARPFDGNRGADSGNDSTAQE